MAGRLIAVVGPSGVGKDTVMEALAAARPSLTLVRRVITRPSQAGGEKFEGVSVPDFEVRREEGAFALSWGAHGLFYGVPTTVDEILAGGQDALVNLSRGMLREAAGRFPGLIVLSLTASRDTLAARLAARGRETPEEIARRLDRAGAPLPPELTVVSMANDGPLAETVAQILAALYPASV